MIRRINLNTAPIEKPLVRLSLNMISFIKNLSLLNIEHVPHNLHVNKIEDIIILLRIPQAETIKKIDKINKGFIKINKRVVHTPTQPAKEIRKILLCMNRNDPHKPKITRIIVTVITSIEPPIINKDL